MPKDQVLVGWHPIPFLLPLLFHSGKTETSRLEDGTLLTHTYGYGTDHGWVLFLLGSIVFVLFQYLARMPRAVASRHV